jgi:K+-sensing histidine kinase KdpD
MGKTLARVTNPCSCDRIISAASILAERDENDLVVVCIIDEEFALNAEAVEYLFGLAKKHEAAMRLIFSANKEESIYDVLENCGCSSIITGMPGGGTSILYKLWKDYCELEFYVVDLEGQIVEVAKVIPRTA